MNKLERFNVWLFIFLGFSAILVFVLQKSGFVLPKLIHNYYNDFVSIPIVLSVSLWFAKRVRHNNDIRFSFWQCMLLVAMYSWFFESYLPKINSRYSADVFDVVVPDASKYAVILAPVVVRVIALVAAALTGAEFGVLYV
jgi:hypothetical protein